MNSKTGLMAALVGIAMLATPIAAAAKDKNHNFNYSRPARASRAYVASARNFGPVVVNKHDFRNGKHATWMPGPRAIAPVEWRDHRWGDRDDDDYRGYRNYYPAPVYTAPVYGAPSYPAYGGYGGNCRAARSVMYNYNKDRATGHPAAAYDLLRQNQWAFHSGCSVGAPYAGGRFGGFGGVPAYGSYGYNSGYGQPYGGYGQPYGGGSMLTPLLQQFVR